MQFADFLRGWLAANWWWVLPGLGFVGWIVLMMWHYRRWKALIPCLMVMWAARDEVRKD